jgi:hypothetical protein
VKNAGFVLDIELSSLMPLMIVNSTLKNLLERRFNLNKNQYKTMRSPEINLKDIINIRSCDIVTIVILGVKM